MNAPVRILLVEDDDDDYILVRDMLRDNSRLPHNLEWIGQFEPALEAMLQGRHDLYLLDYRLGHQTGMELARKAKAAGCQGPIIFLTGYDDYEVDLEVMKVGAADYLLKAQINAPLLERSIRYALERNRHEAALQKERDKLKSIYDAMPEGILVVHESRGVEYVNPALVKNFGAPAGRTCHDYLYDRPEACRLCPFSEVLQDEKIQKEFRFDRISRTFDILCTSLPNTDGTVSLLYILHDITDRKQAEQQIRESARQLRQLSGRLLSAQEDERKKIAGDIHDILGAGLSAVKFKMDILQRQNPESPGGGKESLSDLIPLVQEIIGECRRMQQDLRPSLLDDLGLLSTLSWFSRQMQTIYQDVIIEIEQEVEEQDIPEPLKIVIYRVTQEAMNNMAKYSRGNRVLLTLKKSGDRLIYAFQDNGQGFDPKKISSRAAAEKGLGLSSMKERVELSGGGFAIHSSPGKGTRLQASWPLGK